jgi:hypothetical protein
VILTHDFGEARDKATATGAAISELIYRYEGSH